MSRSALRNLAVLGAGIAVLAIVLFYATTVDLRPPAVSAMAVTQPLATDASVALTTSSVEVNFSERVVTDSAERAFRIEPAVEGTFTWSGSLMTFTPATALPLETDFAVHLEPGVRDHAGNTMEAQSPAFRFTTVGRPTVVAVQPADSADDVPVDAPLELTFSTFMDTASVEGALTLEPSVPVELAWSGEILRVIPDGGFEPGREYRLRVDTDARDTAGNPLAEPLDLRFTTIDVAAEPIVLIPADGAAGISPATPLAAVFDVPLDPASVEGALRIEPPVAGSLEVIAPEGAAALGEPPRTTIVRFQPASALPPNTTFSVELAAGVRGVGGAALAEPVAWRFTTGAPADSLHNQVTFVSDRGGMANVWAMNPDGSNQRQLSVELSPVRAYDVSPDGRRFVVADGARLVEYEADGSNRRVLTDEGLLEYDGAYAPDGTRIAFGRADAETGAGLGIWLRDAGGGAVEPLPTAEEPGDASAAPSAREGSGPAAALLRAPRWSPDGRRLAYVDSQGLVGIVELESGRRSTAAYHALAPPAWLPDGTAAILSGIPDSAGRDGVSHDPERPVGPLDPADLLASGETIDLQVIALARLATGGDELWPVDTAPGAMRPAVAADGTLAYVAAHGSQPWGSLWVMERDESPRRLEIPGGLAALSAAFAPEAGRLAVGAAEAQGRPAGIWSIDARGGIAERLSPDGWAPAWLP